MFTVAMATSGSAVSGFGNGGNRVYADPIQDEVAELLVSTRAAPEVSDQALREIHEAIAAGRRRASSMPRWCCSRWRLSSARARSRRAQAARGIAHHGVAGQLPAPGPAALHP